MSMFGGKKNRIYCVVDPIYGDFAYLMNKIVRNKKGLGGGGVSFNEVIIKTFEQSE